MALWWRDFRATNNAHFLPLLFDRHRYLVLKGGGGSGKSIFAGRKVLERVTSEPGHRWLVCRKVARTLRESCFEQLRGQISDFYPDSGAKVNKSDMSISFANGSKILFAASTTWRSSMFDLRHHGHLVEEASELEQGDFDQAGHPTAHRLPLLPQMILTFNPISITHWLKKRFFDRKDPRATVHESTYLDNRFLTAEAITTLEAFKETDEYYYQVYCLGQWGVTGKTVFDAKKVSERLLIVERAKKPRRGYFENVVKEDGVHLESWAWVDDPDGAVTIYEDVVPGRPYVIGGDTAGDGSDYFVGQVLDNITGKQVCTLRHQYDEDTYARQMYCLGKYYNDALLAIETNFSTYPTKLLDLMGYRNLYVREVEDDFTGKIKHAFGFQTNRLTRPVILSELIRILRESMSTVNDRDTLLEMLTFVRREKDLQGEAEPGAHDDCVMALAIAHYARPQQTMEIKTAGQRKENALDGGHVGGLQQRERDRAAEMLALWGEPR